jgi:hypothetical protein
LEGGVVPLEIFGLKVVGDVMSVDGGSEAVCDSSDEVGDALGFNNLKYAKGRCRRDWREGRLYLASRGRGYSVRGGLI